MNKLTYKITLVGLVLLAGCGDAQDLKKQGLLVVNVLDAEHFNDCHIKGSINVPFEQLDDFAKDLDKDKTKLVFYCSNYMCTASGFAAQKYKQMGFKNVWAYEAGMAEWYQKGLQAGMAERYPVEGLCKKPYLTKEMSQSELDQKDDISILSTEKLAEMMHL